MIEATHFADRSVSNVTNRNNLKTYSDGDAPHHLFVAVICKEKE
jgi:hypothetical protein